MTFGAHLGNPSCSPHPGILNSITSTESLLPYKVVTAPGVRTWISLGGIIQPLTQVTLQTAVELVFCPRPVWFWTLPGSYLEP